MFKVQYLLLLCFIASMANAASIQNSLTNESEAQILSYEYTTDEDGSYKFSFKTSNGITRSETGTIIDKGQPNEHIEVKGRYSYLNTDGQEELVHYIANENGYRLQMPDKPPRKKNLHNRLLSSAVASLLG